MADTCGGTLRTVTRPSRPDLLADAAIEILAEKGARALTHRAVESRAGLGPGATSNCFGTRRALVTGVLQRMLDRERAAMAALPGPAGAEAVTVEQIVALGAAMISYALGPGRSLTLARRALFAEAAVDADLSALLTRASASWWALVADLLRAVGAPRAEQRARWLLAYLDGVIADQLARPLPDLDPADALAPAVFGIVHLPD